MNHYKQDFVLWSSYFIVPIPLVNSTGRGFTHVEWVDMDLDGKIDLLTIVGSSNSKCEFQTFITLISQINNQVINQYETSLVFVFF